MNIKIEINIDHEVNERTKKRILEDVSYDLENKILIDGGWTSIYCTAIPSINGIIVNGVAQADRNRPQFNDDGFNYSI